MMLYKNIAKTMVSMKKVINSRIKSLMSIYRKSILLKVIPTRLAFLTPYIHKSKKYLLILCMQLTTLLIPKRKSITFKFLALTSWSTNASNASLFKSIPTHVFNCHLQFWEALFLKCLTTLWPWLWTVATLLHKNSLFINPTKSINTQFRFKISLS